MEELEMDTIELAMFMAGALAALHWQAGIDARDVEFVLGSAPTFPIVEPLSSEELQKMDPNTSTALRVKRKINFSRRSLHLWVLDFNQCSEITMDNDGIKKAVNAYRVNDPYFPKPSREYERDIDLWNAFAIRYLKVSDRILRHENPKIRNLPKKFIQAVIVDYDDKQQQKAAAAAASESYDP
ncbi:exodeoxyribonuclease iii xth [Neofusicoccum parvum]|uniref:Exodeoxyribonuclease iii xth n=1 Tax=Neofusicoccum parvum TaxID=310453 RepID=A0ACB5SLC7_9PEZI|nr:exodeoxyribonuclease iii xth [Neofusicoccum parvum]